MDWTKFSTGAPSRAQGRWSAQNRMQGYAPPSGATRQSTGYANSQDFLNRNPAIANRPINQSDTPTYSGDQWAAIKAASPSLSMGPAQPQQQFAAPQPRNMAPVVPTAANPVSQQIMQNSAQAQGWYNSALPQMRNDAERGWLEDYYNQNRAGYGLGQGVQDFGPMQDRFGAARNWYDSQLKAGVNQGSLDDYYNQNFSGWMNNGILSQPVPWA